MRRLLYTGREFEMDRINTVEDFEEMKNAVGDKYLEAVTETTPEYLLVIMAQIIEALLENKNIPRKEADERERKAHEEGIIKSIKMLKAVSVIKETAKCQLMTQYDMDEAEADKKIAFYW